MFWFHCRSQQQLREGNVFTGVCHSFCPQGRESASGSLGVCRWVWRGVRVFGSRDVQPPLLDTPQLGLTPPPPDTTVNKGPLCILLECSIVLWFFCLSFDLLHFSLRGNEQILKQGWILRFSHSHFYFKMELSLIFHFITLCKLYLVNKPICYVHDVCFFEAVNEP